MSSPLPAWFEEAWLHLESGPLRALSPERQEILYLRLRQFLPDALAPLQLLYGDRPDVDRWVRRLLAIVARRHAERPSDLHTLDLRRGLTPDWYQQPAMLGYVAYAERFAGTLAGVAAHIPYLKELGVTYLHLMPLLKPREGNNDGGYAVADYRAVRPDLGTMDDLRNLAAQLRAHEMSLCIDLVCNHTAREHEWARRALAGDPVYQDYYIMFPDRDMPDAYEKTLPEVFPDFAPGNFTYYEAIDRWVWTTFNEFQWDLNYRNPAVFAAILDIILYLANQGAEILRLDAVAFMWKRLGTDSQNQPEAHAILQAWRALSRMAAPGLILKAEAIVAPEKLVPYLGRGPAANRACELAYHNVFMVLLWSALAERRVVLLTHAMQNMPTIPSRTAWVTYVRCHDDVGWAVSDEHAAAVGLSGPAHRAFLSDFYSGRFPGSFAQGVTFQHNPRTGDRRISGALASMAGLDTALAQADPYHIDLAVRRILLLHSLIFAYGGVPLIYMGDELGQMNDVAYLEDPALADDNRWLHRPFMDWDRVARRFDGRDLPGRIFQGLRQLIAARQATPALHADADARPVWIHNDHVFALVRESARGRVLVLANFTAERQRVAGARLAALAFRGGLRNILDGRAYDAGSDLLLDAYETRWLTPPPE